MHDARTKRSLSTLNAVVKQAVYKRSVGMPGAGMDDDSRRLVDDQKMLVFERDRQIDSLGL